MQQRIQTLLQQLKKDQTDGMLVCSLQNVRYLSGFSSNEPFVAFLVISSKGNVLITDYRFGEQAKNECKDFEVIVRNRRAQTLGQAINAIAQDHQIKHLGFERDHVLYGMQTDLKSDITQSELIATSGLIEKIRRVKDEQEVTSIRKAAQIGDKALDQLLGILKPGMTEKEAALELEYFVMKGGSEGFAFPTIFISGVRTSMPHGMPSDKKIATGDMVTVDFGAVINGYRSDMTRTFVMGKASEEQKQVYNIIHEAQQVGVDSVKAGIPAKEPYLKVSEILNACKYVEHVGEGLGHCVGLSLHERPYLDATCEDILEENFVLTVEPGIYIPNWGGVRIEDDLRVTRDGCEILTHAPKHLIEL